MKADTWMPFYISDYLRDTMRLTTEQHGAYLLLIMAAWTAGGELPDDPDELAAAAKMTRGAWLKAAPVILRFFIREGGVLRHKRVTGELEKAERMAEVRRQNGARGGRPKNQNITGEEPAGYPAEKLPGKLTETPTRVAPPSPSPLPPEGSEANASATGGGALDPDGDTWRMVRLLLADRHGMSPAASGKFFGGLLKVNGLEARDMMGAVAEATGNGTLDAKGFLTGAAAHRAKKRAGPQLSPSELAMRSNIQ